MIFKGFSAETKELEVTLKNESDEISKLTSLSTTIKNNEELIKEYQENIKSLEDDIKALESKRNDALKDVEKIVNENDDIRARHNDILKELVEIKKQYETDKKNQEKRIEKEFSQINILSTKENSMYVSLYSDTHTTPIMDEFYNSDKLFLFLSDWSGNEWWDKIVLVITHGYNNIPHYDVEAPTMTELKTSSHCPVTSGYFPERMKPLMENIANIIKKKKMKHGEVVQFKYPYPLGGQIYANQTDFGWEWQWGELLKEGTLYGETTQFFIIGFQYINNVCF